MTSNDVSAPVRVVEWLTAARRPLLRAWGWRRTMIGFGVSSKCVEGRTLPGTACVTFFVRRKKPSRVFGRLERIPEFLTLDRTGDTVFTDVVELGGSFVAHAGHTVRPLQPGAEIGHLGGGLGTLGLIVRNTATRELLALSCSHVIARSGHLGDLGRSIQQPVERAPEVVGSLVSFSEIWSGQLTTEDIALASVTTPVDPPS